MWMIHSESHSEISDFTSLKRGSKYCYHDLWVMISHGEAYCSLQSFSWMNLEKVGLIQEHSAWCISRDSYDMNHPLEVCVIVTSMIPDENTSFKLVLLSLQTEAFRLKNSGDVFEKTSVKIDSHQVIKKWQLCKPEFIAWELYCHCGRLPPTTFRWKATKP